MQKPQRVGDLEIFQDPAFQRRFWLVQRAGWVLIAVLVAAGALGVFGQGPLSHAREEAGGLAVEYERFTRRDSPAELRLHVSGQAVQGGRVTIAFDNVLLRDLEIDSIVPGPAEVLAGDTTTAYVFRAMAGAKTDIVVPFKARRWGRLQGRVSVAGRDGPLISMLVYP